MATLNERMGTDLVKRSDGLGYEDEVLEPPVSGDRSVYLDAYLEPFKPWLGKD